MNAQPLHGAAIVGVFELFLFCPLPCRHQKIPIKNLRGLDGPEGSPIRSALHFAVLAHHLNGVLHRNGRSCGMVRKGHIHRFANDFFRDQRSRSVLHRRKNCLRAGRFQSRLHRRHAILTAGHNGADLVKLLFLHQLAHLLQPVFPGHYHDLVNTPYPLEAADGVGNHRLAVQVRHDLIHAPHPCGAACRNDHRRAVSPVLFPVPVKYFHAFSSSRPSCSSARRIPSLPDS